MGKQALSFISSPNHIDHSSPCKSLTCLPALPVGQSCPLQCS